MSRWPIRSWSVRIAIPAAAILVPSVPQVVEAVADVEVRALQRAG